MSSQSRSSRIDGLAIFAAAVFAVCLATILTLDRVGAPGGLVRAIGPVLALIGEKDRQVPARENLSQIESTLKTAGNNRVTVKELPGLNHLFQKCETGAPSEYAGIEQTIDPSALAVIADWISEQAGSVVK